MKSNVDLTENGDFRAQFNNYYESPIHEYIYYGRFGVLLEPYYIDKDAGAIMQGNATKRRTKLLCNEFNVGNYCDRCGVPIKPYINDCLYPKCLEKLKKKLFFKNVLT